MTIQTIIDEINELNAIPSSLTVTSTSEPYQKEWEDEWVSQGNSLPIAVGTELYWNDGSQLRGMYMVVPDKFTIPTRYSKIIDTADPVITIGEIPSLRNIWIRWWYDDLHLIGVGTYDGVTGTYKMYMDGVVELITTTVAVAVHSLAQQMVVQDGTDLKLYDLTTDTLGGAIDSVSWTAELYGPNMVVEDFGDNKPTNSGWGFTERVAWADETNVSNIDFYYGDHDDVYFYEDGVGTSLLFSIGLYGTEGVVSICHQNSLLAICYEVDTSDNYVATVYDFNGDVIFDLGSSGEELSIDYDGEGSVVWGRGLYRVWHFRKTPDSTTLIDVLRPEAPIRYGIAKRFDTVPGDQRQPYGSHTWERYLRYDTVGNQYQTKTIYDLRVNDLQNLGNELVSVPSDVTTAPAAIIDDRHGWGAALVSNRKKCYTFAHPSPDSEKLLLGYGESFGIKSNTQDRLTQGDRYGGQQYDENSYNDAQGESGRHGSVVVAIGLTGSSGRVYRVSDYTEPSPTEMVIYTKVLEAATDTIDVDLTDIIAALSEDYEILKVQIQTASSATGSLSVWANDNVLPGDYKSRAFFANGSTVGSVDDDGSSGLRIPVAPTDTGEYLLTFHDFRAAYNHITMFAEGGYYGGTSPFQVVAAGYLDQAAVADPPTLKPLLKLLFTHDTGTFNVGNKIVITVLRTKGKYSNGGQNDYRMA
ncbi:MAG: hypothetical protein KAS32_11565 [Candidatus Peribacteraceae bacterium]|nr:hypothetical protein [Candidatus Peribacteraceae bacterium]